ncbi:MAG: hypothetical protein JSS53_00235, partial [Proteobacteria bacterium]|nr:hypothetical protein [Pseudomonadota bacterium]
MINLFQRFKWIILPLSFAGLHLVCINSHAEEEAKFLSLRDAVLLSLRYNPSIMTSEINRVVQKFNLRVAQNQFELQYALTGSVNFASSTVSGVRQPSSTTYGLNPSVQLQSHLGTQY